MGIRNYTNTGEQSTLTGAIGATDTSFTLANYGGDPTPPYTAALARGTVTEEIVLVTGVAGSTVTVTRGYDGTSAQAQGAGATFQEVVIAQDFREANSHVNATTNVHGLGLGSAVVGTTDAQSLTNKTLVSPSLSNPTFTGSATMNAVTVASLSVSGAATLTTLSATSTATIGGTLGVTGALTASGGLTVPTGHKATLTDAPVASTDAANKAYVDGKTWPTTALSDATSAPTANTAVKRDGSGRAQFADPAVAADVASKSYVDSKVASDTGWQTLTLNAPATGTAKYRVLGGVLHLQLNENYTGAYTSTYVHATLPAGARPGSDQFVDGVYFNNGNEILWIKTDGTINNRLGTATVASDGFIAQGSFPL